MAQDSWPAPGHNSGALTEFEWESVAYRMVDDGAYGDPTETAFVVAGVGLNVTVKAEKHAQVRGHHWYSGTSDYTHVISPNVSGSTRLDRVVLQLDRANWTVRSVVKIGTPGAGRPSLQQDPGSTGLYEIPLTTVTVLNSASSVTVAREEVYVGSRVRPCTSSAKPTIPRLGDLIYETDTGRWRGWNGSAWIVMRESSASAAAFDIELGQYTTTSTTYTTSATGSYVECGVVFVAPSSGRVKITVVARLDNSTTSATCVSAETRAGGSIGSGSVVEAADTPTGVLHNGADDTRIGAAHVLSGLTAGSTYNVRLLHKVSTAATGTISERELLVEPF